MKITIFVEPPSATGEMKSEYNGAQSLFSRRIPALKGLVGPHQKLILSAQLEHIDFLNRQIAELDKEIERRMRPFEEALELLDTIPGVGRCSLVLITFTVGKKKA